MESFFIEEIMDFKGIVVEVILGGVLDVIYLIMVVCVV